MEKEIAIAILAAGASTRMGQPKQLLDFRGESLIRKVIKVALSSDSHPVLVVLGAHAAAIKPEIEDQDVVIVENSAWQQGLSTSIRTAVAALHSNFPQCSAVLFLLADQPFVSPVHLSAIKAAYFQTGLPIVASYYGEKSGVPALFDQSLFAALLSLQGDQGAGTLIKTFQEKVFSIKFPEGIWDIDTPEDYDVIVRK